MPNPAATVETANAKSAACEILDAQRHALRSFLAAQDRRKSAEQPVAPYRKRLEDAARQQADASRRKVDEERRDLQKLHEETREGAHKLLQSVNQSWNETSSALRAADMAHLLSDPGSFRLAPDGIPSIASLRLRLSLRMARKGLEEPRRLAGIKMSREVEEAV